jgi:hypothetical protein
MKIHYSQDDSALIDPAFDGVVEEAHTCRERFHVALQSGLQPA